MVKKRLLTRYVEPCDRSEVPLSLSYDIAGVVDHNLSWDARVCVVDLATAQEDYVIGEQRLHDLS